ncbi:MAG TPA: GAF domain-containing protein, partial [Aquihabitans sp.]|nr:GAF domain-containing protein [Aquihabitans sp.]
MARWELASPQRLDALAEVDVVPGVPDADFDVYTRLVARLLSVPVALVSLVDAERQVFASSIGLADLWRERGQTPLSMSFCQHVVVHDAPLVVADSETDERVAGNRAIDVLGVRAYLGTPLHAPGGEPLGSLCAIADSPRAWTDDDLAALTEVAEAASQAIALRTSEHRQRARVRDASHRLRTPISAARLELEDMVLWPDLDGEVVAGLQRTDEHLVHLADVVAELLDAGREAGRHEVAEVDVAALAAAVADRWRREAEAAGRDLVVDAPGETGARTDGPALRHALDALVANAVQHGTGRVAIQVWAKGGACRVRVVDE